MPVTRNSQAVTLSRKFGSVVGLVIQESARQLATAAATLTSGSAAPSEAEPESSVYLQTSGADHPLRVSDGTSWAHADTVYRAAGTIDSDDVKTLNATPVALVAAPGAGFYIEFDRAHFWLDYGTTAYDGIATGEDLILSYTDSSGEEVARVETTGFLDATADAHRNVHVQAAKDADGAYAPAANAALVLSLLSGEIATGDSDLKYEVYYRVKTLEFSVS